MNDGGQVRINTFNSAEQAERAERREVGGVARQSLIENGAHGGFVWENGPPIIPDRLISDEPSGCFSVFLILKCCTATNL
jgi:hypothetical protein